jgi:nucleotide-binding universal stress UspA family protein
VRLGLASDGAVARWLTSRFCATLQVQTGNVPRKEETMTRVLAVIGPEPETLLAAERAIAFAESHGAELNLLGVIDSRRSFLRKRTGRRPEAAARAHLRDATRRAAAAGVPPRLLWLRRGRVLEEMARVVGSPGADVVFLTRLRPRWWARLLGRPHAELQEITLSRRSSRAGRAVGAEVGVRVPEGCPACREEHESLRALVAGEG